MPFPLMHGPFKSLGVERLLLYKPSTDFINGVVLAAGYTAAHTAQSFTVKQSGSLVVVAIGGMILNFGNNWHTIHANLDAGTRYPLGGCFANTPNGGYDNYFSGTSLLFLPNLAIGSHTIGTDMGASGTPTVYCRPATYPQLEGFHLSVFELRHSQRQARPSWGSFVRRRLQYAVAVDTTVNCTHNAWTDLFANQTFNVEGPGSLVIVSIRTSSLMTAALSNSINAASAVVLDGTNYLIGSGFSTSSAGASDYINPFGSGGVRYFTGLTRGAHTLKAAIFQVSSDATVKGWTCNVATAPRDMFFIMDVLEIPEAA